MTDLGFGLVDRRSVLAVLFALALSNVLFQNPFPVDTTSPNSIFASLVTLTGFIYLTRVAVRVAMSLLLFILYVPYNLVNYGRFVRWNNEEKLVSFLWIAFLPIYVLVLSLRRGLLVPLFSRMDWQWDQVGLRSKWEFSVEKEEYKYTDYALGLLGILDRASLAAIAYAATLPAYAPMRDEVGMYGIAALLAVYILSGRFTFVVKDALHKAEEDAAKGQKSIAEAAKNPKFPEVIYTKPAKE